VNFPTIEFSDSNFTPPGFHLITVKSPAIRGRADISVFIPQVEPTTPLPLVTLLHGVYGSHWAWLFKAGAHEVMLRLIKEENLPPMALAMPSDGLLGDGSGYLHHVDADYRAWIVEEVPAAVSQLDSRIENAPRFLCGLSMGGYGTLRLGALYPNHFSALSAHSSVTDASDLNSFLLPDSKPLNLDESDPLDVLTCLKANAATLPPFRFDCGVDDPLISSNRRLHNELNTAGIPHSYQEFSGGHSWDYWSKHLADSLRFFAATLSTPSR
jgi:putative tributyrin esterase